MPQLTFPYLAREILEDQKLILRIEEEAAQHQLGDAEEHSVVRSGENSGQELPGHCTDIEMFFSDQTYVS